MELKILEPIKGQTMEDTGALVIAISNVYAAAFSAGIQGGNRSLVARALAREGVQDFLNMLSE